MKTIFWDFDGTLTYSQGWAQVIFNLLTEELPNVSAELDEMRSRLGAVYPWNRYECDWRTCVGDAFWEYLFGHFAKLYRSYGASPVQAESMARRVREAILRPERYTLYPDALPTLRTFKERGYRNCILSNNYPELWNVMEKLGIMEYAEGGVVSGEEGYDKPRPELYALAKKYAADPNDCVMVGDNPIADIWGAKQAGMTAILVHRSIDGCRSDGMPDFVCDTLAEILNIL